MRKREIYHPRIILHIQNFFLFYIITVFKITWAAANRAFIELMGSEGSKADKGMPAAWAAASKAAFEADAAAALEELDGLERDLGGGPPVRGEALEVSCRPLLSLQ